MDREPEQPRRVQTTILISDRLPEVWLDLAAARETTWSADETNGKSLKGAQFPQRHRLKRT
jgi:hypothetical protein